MSQESHTHTQPDALSLELDGQNIAWLAIDVPNEKMNTLQASFVDKMDELLQSIEQNSAIKGLVIYSKKPDNFVAGADIRMLDACQTAQDASNIARFGQEVFDRIASLKITSVAAIHGPCLGGGMELALACDYRVVSDDDKTKLGLPEVQLGLLPGSGGTQRMPRLIGLLNALDLILTGKQVRAKKAKKLGLADALVPVSILNQVASTYAQKEKPKRQLDKKSQLAATGLGSKLILKEAGKKAQAKARHNYPAIDLILETIATGLQKGFKAGLEKEANAFGELVMSPESKALRHIFFSQTALKKDRGADAKPQDIQAIGVLGGGLMGAGIAYVSAVKANKSVRIKDVAHDGVLKGLQYSHKLLLAGQKRGIYHPRQVQYQMQKISGGVDFTGFQSLDLVAEAVFEDLELKQKMVAEVEAHCADNTIFATNTSSIPIADIAANAKRAENIIGLHYFSPVEKMPLVEVILHQSTSAQTISTTVALAKAQGKTPIVVQDKAGFYVNRILAPYMNEAARILVSGEPVEKIDKALVDFGFPVGPMNLLDEVGVDIGAKITPILENAFGSRFSAPNLFDILLEDKRLGKKSGKGFYKYTKCKKTAKKEVDPKVYELLNISIDESLNPEVIAKRCTYLMLNEAVRTLDEGIIKSARDGDIGAIFGIGFPPFLGGPFHYMDSVGLDVIVQEMQAFANDYGEHFMPCEALVTRAKTGQSFY